MHKKSRINYATDSLRFLNFHRRYMRNRLSAKLSTDCRCYILQAHQRHPKYQVTPPRAKSWQTDHSDLRHRRLRPKSACLRSKHCLPNVTRWASFVCNLSCEGLGGGVIKGGGGCFIPSLYDWSFSCDRVSVRKLEL